MGAIATDATGIARAISARKIVIALTKKHAAMAGSSDRIASRSANRIRQHATRPRVRRRHNRSRSLSHNNSRRDLSSPLQQTSPKQPLLLTVSANDQAAVAAAVVAVVVVGAARIMAPQDQVR